MTIHPPGPGEPDTIGRYRVLGTLESTIGFHTLLAVGPDDSLVVVRQAQPELLDEADFRIRLRHSAVAAMRVSGAMNTTVIDVDADADKPWLASLFVPGVRLDRAVAEHGQLPVPAVRALAGALAAALRTVHAAGLVHQRLRADSVLLARDSGRLGEIGITPVAGPPSTGSATTLGTPDFLSPEQALGLAITPAADVFALGSVLAFAASGSAPFTAPSVPYTLFNIAQREPDLSQVPEALVELIAACLRKDPAARPTPGQILEYLGGAPAAPAPWPAPVLDDIGRQQDQVAALLAALPPIAAPQAPPARPWPEVIAGVGQKTLDMCRRAVRSGRQRWSAVSLGRRRGLAGGLAALLLVAGGGTYVATRPATIPPPVTGLTLAQLRQLDACAWLESALGDAVPVAPTPLPADTWKLSPSTSWGCFASSNRNLMTLALGAENSYLTPHQNIIDGVPIIDGSSASCTRAIASPGAESPAGIVITLSPASGEGCEGIDYIAANIARSLSSAPRAENRESSLALVEPCSLVDRDLVTAEIGELPPEPTIADAHTCQWDARVQLTVKLLRTSSLTSGGSVVTVSVDGMQVYLDQGATNTICTRAYLAPGSDKETVEVTVTGRQGGRDESCAIATDVLRGVATKLPTR
ncbi:protein kinase [Nocardia sp. NPDC060259]|uniref:protein kinase domain-containing protein n=1 Tax=Nocardia sp. NPDC060259 TaxID=3347088 RepID=UPI003665C9AA